MADVLLLFAVAAAVVFGMAQLALAQPRHRAAVGDGRASPVRLRWVGGIACVTALVLSILRDGPAFGIILWLLALSAGTFAVAMFLAWRPRWLGWLLR